MVLNLHSISHYAFQAFWIWISIAATLIGVCLLRCLYNISPLHPLARYPGPLFWRATRLLASYHHARGTLYQQIAHIHTTYGTTVRIAPDELSFSNPSAWTQIYNSRPQLSKSRYHFAPPDQQRLPESMITATDTEHARLRRLAGPAFLNAGISEVEPVLQLYTDLLCSQLIASAQSEGGSTTQNVVSYFLWTLNDVIGKLALDQEFQCLEKRRMHPWPQFLLSVLKITAALNQFVRFGLPLKLLTLLMSEKAKKDRDMFFDTATTAVSKRLAKEKVDDLEEADTEAGLVADEKIKLSTAKGARHPDIVGLMLREMKGRERLTDAEITANSVLIVGGGAETTSTCLSATLYHLCKTPRVMTKLKDEIRTTFASSEAITVKACHNLPYLKATIDESLRIFPVASYITPRMTPQGGHIIGGQLTPGGTYVSMGQWYMGRSEKFFSNAKEFKPERWLAENIKEIAGPAGLTTDEILKPFSMGPRNCIGKLLALAEARLVTAKLLWHFDVELVGEHDGWVEGARFYILWELMPLRVKLTPVQR